MRLGSLRGGCAAIVLLVFAFLLLSRALSGIDPTARTVGAIIIAGTLAAAFALARWRRMKAEAARRADLVSRFGEEIAERILNQEFWIGQTEEQLRESIGDPVDVAEKRTKNRVVHTFKYNQTGRGRFGLKVTLEDGAVTGWDQK